MSHGIDLICQVVACICGVTSIFLIARKNKWGFVVGLTAQPAWYYTTIFHEQWMILVLSIAYTLNWCYGIYNWFWKK